MHPPNRVCQVSQQGKRGNQGTGRKEEVPKDLMPLDGVGAATKQSQGQEDTLQPSPAPSCLAQGFAGELSMVAPHTRTKFL